MIKIICLLKSRFSTLNTIYNFLDYPKLIVKYQTTRRNLEYNKNIIGGSVITKNIMHNKKKSNTLFFLGSGPSINQLGNKQFEIISKNDSIAVTQFLKHKFVANFYTLEISSYEQYIEMYESIKSNLNLNKRQYKNSFFILRPKKIVSQKQKDFIRYIHENFEHAWDFPRSIMTKKPITFKRTIKILDRMKILKSNSLFVDYNATLLWCIFFAYKLGYEKIVLCGVDLEGPYFFEKQNYEISQEKKHSTLEKSEMRGLSIIEVIKILNEFFNKKNMTIYTDSNCKKLSRILPIYRY